MTAVSRSTLHSRNALLRPIAIGGLVVFIVQILQTWIVQTLSLGNPFISVWQYIASGVIGPTAFEGGWATASLGLLIHLLISVAIAAIFIISVDRLAFVRRHVIVSSLVYGFVVFIVMNLIVTPLSAAPPVPMLPTPWLIETVLEHVLGVGLPLGILMQRTGAAT